MVNGGANSGIWQEAVEMYEQANCDSKFFF